MPVGTYLYLHAVDAGNHVAVPCLAREGAARGTDSCDPRDQQLSGSPVRRVWKNIISVHRQMDLPLGQSDMSFPRLNTRIYSPDDGAGAASAKKFLAKKGTDGSAEGRGCWSWRRTAGKHR
jgi:hypothetical protein